MTNLGPKSMINIVRLAASVLCAVSILSACTGTPTAEEMVDGPPVDHASVLRVVTDETMLRVVVGEPSSTRLELGVNTCNQNPQAEVEESAEDVRIQIVVDQVQTGDRNDCADNTKVVLKEPLGDRQVVNAETGKVIQVTPPE